MEGCRKKPQVVLSIQEKKVLGLIVKGKTNREIADELFVSIHTVKAHVQHILKKLSVKSRVQAAVIASNEYSL